MIAKCPTYRLSRTLYHILSHCLPVDPQTEEVLAETTLRMLACKFHPSAFFMYEEAITTLLVEHDPRREDVLGIGQRTASQ